MFAWNDGKACDLKWLWQLTQAPNLRYSLPPNIKYFLDPPYCVIEKYKTCAFNKTRSKIKVYELGVLFGSMQILGKNSESGIWMTIVDITIFRLILHCQS